jgi:hypothetical protein
MCILISQWIFLPIILYGPETWSLTRRHRLRVVEIVVQGRVLEPVIEKIGRTSQYLLSTRRQLRPRDKASNLHSGGVDFETRPIHLLSSKGFSRPDKYKFYEDLFHLDPSQCVIYCHRITRRNIFWVTESIAKYAIRRRHGGIRIAQ